MVYLFTEVFLRIVDHGGYILEKRGNINQLRVLSLESHCSFHRLEWSQPLEKNEKKDGL